MAASGGLLSKTLQLCKPFFLGKKIIWSSTFRGCFSKDLNGIPVRLSSSEIVNSSSKEGIISKHVERSDEVELSEQRNISVEKLFSEIGLPLNKVKKQMDITRLSLERVKEKIEILQGIGLKMEDVGKVLTRRPSVLVIRNEVLQSRVEALKKAGVEPRALAYAVKNSPGILTGRTEETLTSKIKYLISLNVKPKLTKEEVLHMLTKCPDIMASCRLESIQNKITFLEKVLKFNQHQLRNILLKQPTVLTFSTDSMRSKFAYCYDALNATRSSIARCPRVFQCSLKRIQERHQYLLKVGRLKDDMIVDDYGLGVIITQTDKYFAEKVALSTLDDFDEFRTSLSDGSNSIQ